MIVFTYDLRYDCAHRDRTGCGRIWSSYYCGMLPWLLFANSMTSAANSLLGSQHLVTKVYFPRLILPIASVVTALLDFAIAFVVLLAMMLRLRGGAGAADRFPAGVRRAGVRRGARLRSVAERPVDAVQGRAAHGPLRHPALAVLYPRSSTRRQRSAAGRVVLLDLNPMSAIVEGFRWCAPRQPVAGAAGAGPVHRDDRRRSRLVALLLPARRPDAGRSHLT